MPRTSTHRPARALAAPACRPGPAAAGAGAPGGGLGALSQRRVRASRWRRADARPRGLGARQPGDCHLCQLPGAARIGPARRCSSRWPSGPPPRSPPRPDNCQALYWQAYALGRYSQGISVARALAQGLGGKVKGALERVIELQPHHADAHVGARRVPCRSHRQGWLAGGPHDLRRARRRGHRALRAQPGSSTPTRPVC